MLGNTMGFTSESMGLGLKHRTAGIAARRGATVLGVVLATLAAAYSANDREYRNPEP